MSTRISMFAGQAGFPSDHGNSDATSYCCLTWTILHTPKTKTRHCRILFESLIKLPHFIGWRTYS